mgnify:CR=1 FL=1
MSHATQHRVGLVCLLSITLVSHLIKIIIELIKLKHFECYFNESELVMNKVFKVSHSAINISGWVDINKTFLTFRFTQFNFQTASIVELI